MAALMVLNVFHNWRLDRMKNRLLVDLAQRGDGVDIAALLKRGSIRKKEAELALRALQTMTRDGTIEFSQGGFYLKDRMSGIPYPSTPRG